MVIMQKEKEVKFGRKGKCLVWEGYREKKRDNNKFSEREIICSRMESEKEKEEQILEKEKRDGL